MVQITFRPSYLQSCSPQIFEVQSRPAATAERSEHAGILGLLAVLVVDDESDGAGALGLGEVAQVHERALGEQTEVGVAEPYEELEALRLEDACESVHGLRTSQTGAGVKHEFLGALFLAVRHQASQGTAQLS